MNVFLIILLMLPVVANCAGITKINGNYDSREDSQNNAKVVIDLTKRGQSVEKSFYGSHFDSYSQMPSEDLLEELQLGKIRVGGNEFDVSNWLINKSVTSTGKIIDVADFSLLSKVLRKNRIDGIFQINLTGYRPEQDGNRYVIKRSFTEDSAYEMIKHLNGKLNLRIVDFGLGNEFSIWNETHPKVWEGSDGITADEYIDRYIKFAVAIRRAQEEVSGDPNSIKIWGPDISTSWYDWNTSNFKIDCKWTDTRGEVACRYGNGKFTHFLPYFFHRLKMAEKGSVLNPKRYKLLDYMAIHYYPNFRTNIDDPSSVITDKSGRQSVALMLESTRVLNDPSFINKIDISSYRNFTPNILGRMNHWMKEYYPDARMVMNEFAVDSDYRSNYYHPIVRPLYLADVIGILTKENVAFFNQFQLSSYEGANLPWSMIEGNTKKDLFYMYKLFTNNFKGNLLEVEDNFGDAINSYATMQDNIINLALINKEPVERSVKIYIKGTNTQKIADYIIPAWSASILKLTRNPGPFSRKFEIFQFGAKEMGIPIDTSYQKK